MFNTFRRTENFTCFQEALHEIAFLAREDPEQLLSISGTGENQKELRHPALDKPYFFELHARHSYWKDHISPEAIFDAAFPEYDQTSTVEFFDALIKSSDDKPSVFQECRTPFRIRALKAALKGTHIYLSRNPLEQWWSQKTTPYFEIANRLFIDAHRVPPSVNLLKNRINFQSSNQVDLVAKYQFHTAHQLRYEHQFEVFLLLWSLGEIQAHHHADIRVDMDAISENLTAKNKLVRQFEDIGIHGIDLSDCHVPYGSHSSDEIEMLNEKSVIVLDLLKTSGSSSDDLDIVEKAINQVIEKSKQNLFQGDRSHLAKFKAISKSQHENTFQLLNEAHGALKSMESSVKSKEQEVKALQSEKASIVERLNALENNIQHKDLELAVLSTEKTVLENERRLKEQKLDALLIEKSKLESDSRLKDKELEFLLNAKTTLENDQQLKAKEIETLLDEQSALCQDIEDRENTIQRLKQSQEQQKRVSTKLRKDIIQYKDQKAELISGFETLDSAHRNFITASSDVQTHLTQTNSKLANTLALEEMKLEKVLTARREREVHVETLQEMAAHLSAVINNKDEQISAIKATTSWRVTSPLRAVRGCISWGSDAIKSKGLVAIRRSPFFKSLVLMFLLPFPHLKGRLESYAIETETVDSLVETTDHLPIYTHENHWNLVPTLPSAKKWQDHFKRAK